MAGWRWWADRASPVPFPWPANMHHILTLNLSKGEAPDGRLWRSSFDKLRIRAFIRAAAHPSGGLQIEQHDIAVQRQAATVERGDECEGGGAFDGFLPVLREAAAASQPCECPLHDRRRGRTTKPLAVSERLTISMVQRPWPAIASLSLSPE